MNTLLRVALILSCLVLMRCSSAPKIDVSKFETNLRAELPNGSSKEKVVNYLRGRNIEYGEESQSKKVVAIIRDVDRGQLTQRSVQFIFAFDDKGLLTSIERKDLFTGP